LDICAIPLGQVICVNTVPKDFKYVAYSGITVGQFLKLLSYILEFTISIILVSVVSGGASGVGGGGAGTLKFASKITMTTMIHTPAQNIFKTSHPVVAIYFIKLFL
jgi:hypothetical protein